MSSCDNSSKNNCTCTYNCPRKGSCCQCVAYHRAKNQIPACFFDKEAEKTYDRSIDFFIKSKKHQHLS